MSTNPSSPPPATTTTAELRACSICFRELPAEAFRFRFRATGERHRNCNDCLRRYQRDQLRPRKAAALLSSEVTKLANPEAANDARLTAAVLRRMLRHFGGLEAMCDYWADTIKAATARRPGHQLALRTFNAILQMAAVLEKASQDDYIVQRQSLQTLSTEDLDAAIRSALR